MPLLINCIREFCMMALFAPAVFVAMMSLCFGSDRIPRKLIFGIFALGFVLGLVFVVLNARAIGGSEEIFRFGNYPAYDGVWFKSDDPHIQALMSELFVIRFIDPLFLLLLAGVIVFRHARHYPEEKGVVYDNMPKKLYFLSAAVFAFPVSMLITGILVLFFNIPNPMVDLLSRRLDRGSPGSRQPQPAAAPGRSSQRTQPHSTPDVTEFCSA